MGRYDRKIAGTADSKHPTFKCLVNSLKGNIKSALMTPRFLTKVNTYISEASMDDLYLITKFCWKNNPRNHE